MDGTMTLRGRVGTDLQTSRTKTGTLCVRFRLAVSQWRRTDSGNYEELGVRWYSIRAWGRLAEYVLPSVRKGDPVVIVGRPMANAWTDGAGEIRSDLVFNAVAMGHDLSFGTATFHKRGGPAPTITEPAYLNEGAPQASVSTQASPPGSEYRSDFHAPENAEQAQEQTLDSGTQQAPADQADAQEGAFHSSYDTHEALEHSEQLPAA